MKIKSYLLATVLAFALFSCSKDNDNGIENNSTTEKQILNFSSEKEMQEKIAEIEAFKNAKEQQIIQKISHRNNLSAPTLADIKNTSKTQLTEADKAKVLEGVKFYHQEKLKAIYAERAHFGFTSIQSIADEINSLKLINNTKSNQLYDNYKSFLTKNEYEISTIFDKNASIVTNKKGELYLKSKEISNKYLMNTDASNRFVANLYIKQGIVTIGYNGFIQITYHSYVRRTDKEIYMGDLYFNTTTQQYEPMYRTEETDTPSNKLACYVLSNVGYVAYPCYFYTNTNSYATFSGNASVNLNNQTIPFPVGVAKEIDYYGAGTNYANQPSITGRVSGSFAVPVSGTNNFLWVTGSTTF
ncbi:MAG: hypothetical protein V4670_11025 [Bacteroidota bacterium]